jgi:hypothetical protein
MPPFAAGDGGHRISGDSKEGKTISIPLPICYILWLKVRSQDNPLLWRCAESHAVSFTAPEEAIYIHEKP